MVGFVTGLSYVATSSVDWWGQAGIALTEILGGFVSSTVTTVSMAEWTTEAPNLYNIGAFSIVMYPRGLDEVAVVNPALLPRVVVPLSAMTGVGPVTGPQPRAGAQLVMLLVFTGVVGLGYLYAARKY